MSLLLIRIGEFNGLIVNKKIITHFIDRYAVNRFRFSKYVSIVHSELGLNDFKDVYLDADKFVILSKNRKTFVL